MIVLYPGDQVHITFWYDPDKESVMEACEKIKPIFEGHGVHIYSHCAVHTAIVFPMQVIAFRNPTKYVTS